MHFIESWLLVLTNGFHHGQCHPSTMVIVCLLYIAALDPKYFMPCCTSFGVSSIISEWFTLKYPLKWLVSLAPYMPCRISCWRNTFIGYSKSYSINKFPIYHETALISYKVREQFIAARKWFHPGLISLSELMNMWAKQELQNNSLWPSHTIWCHGSWSTLLMALSHYLNQCWLNIS